MGAIAGILHGNSVENVTDSFKQTMLKRGPLGLEQIIIPQGVLLHSKRNMETGCFSSEEYDMVFSGSLYNREELSRELNLPCNGQSAGDLLLNAYGRWGSDCLNKLNGVFAFAIWEKKKHRLFLARDQMGTRPLFYCMHGKTLIFASEIKTILAVPGMKASLNRQGAMELIMLGPGRMPGSGVLEGIHELQPGYMGMYEQGKLTVSRYWHLTDGPHEDSLDETAEKIRFLISDAVRRQSEGEYGTFLSGGLDSSILSALCAGNKEETLKTFSVDYLNNSRYFEPGKFQPDSDASYISCMTDFLHSRHEETVLTPEDLLRQMEEATMARDLPGMGDVDFSLLAFCKKVRKSVPMVFSGECADEIFGGYPWYRDPALREKAGFPWAQNTALRKKLMYHPPEDAEDFVWDLCRDTCSQADILPDCSPQDRRIKELVNLNLRWFMQTLVDRNDRMSAAAGLEVRVPFCDLRIAEYLYRIPWEMKDYEGREKGLLRYAVRDLLPEKVLYRKKSPYPKTFDPAYEKTVTGKLRDLLVLDLPIWYLVSRETVSEILLKGNDTPWYGQLMRRPQFAAWLLQINFWLDHYHIMLNF